MAVFKCKMCGGDLEVQSGMSVGVCQYCGTQQTLPRLDSEKKQNLYDRANHFRRNNEYDRAMGIYEQILSEDNTDAEAYWSIVLCRYGVEYVEDPETKKQIPTINRTQFTSIFADEDYQKAIQYADVTQKEVYEKEAQAIDEIQKGILAISEKEEPFDVFICYKETDKRGRRTLDSVLAMELYNELVEEGLRVFFARITLEDKLGSAYEPYIFGALNSAKVMVVLGTSAENFNAAWVKNEWSRYLGLIKAGAKKTLIPAYKDMDPYDLPEEFSALQAQDMGKIGWMQDMVRGIKKLIGVEEGKVQNAPAQSVGPDEESLLKRGQLFLEDEDWENASEYFDRVLDIDPEYAPAYIGKLCAALHLKKEGDLANWNKPLDQYGEFEKAWRFAQGEYRETIAGYQKTIADRLEEERKEKIYQEAKKKYNSQIISRIHDAKEMFESIANYKDANELAATCDGLAEKIGLENTYTQAVSAKKFAKTEEQFQKAAKKFREASGYLDADALAVECERLAVAAKAQQEEQRALEKKRKEKKKKLTLIIVGAFVLVIAIISIVLAITIPRNKYNEAIVAKNSGDYRTAIAMFDELADYQDSKDQIYEIGMTLYEQRDYMGAAKAFYLVQDSEGARKIIDECMPMIQKQLSSNNALAAGDAYLVGIHQDGTVSQISSDVGEQVDVTDWKDITSISVGDNHIVGLKEDGRVVACGENEDGQCDVNEWQDIIQVDAGADFTVGLKSDGTVVATGNNAFKQCEIDTWTDIIAISAGGYHTVGLRADGTVVATGETISEQCDVEGWTDIVAVSAGYDHTVGLKSDGAVVTTGEKFFKECNIGEWKDIVSALAGRDCIVGLKVDGTVKMISDHNFLEQNDVDGWTDIVEIGIGRNNVIGLRADGTLLIAGYDGNGQYSAVESWKDIKLPA